MTCTGLWYTERDIVGRALSVTTMAVTFCTSVTVLYGDFGRFGPRTARLEGPVLGEWDTGQLVLLWGGVVTLDAATCRPTGLP